jgi:glutamate synthase domain-containing protein 3
MSGGEIVLVPPANSKFDPAENFICGNTCLYGATGGLLIARGRAGERFAVRNSGAVAIVEGVGDHGCEYMTGGLVVVLGRTGRNFGAGMTGGRAFVWDATGEFPSRVNGELVHCERVTEPQTLQELHNLIARHVELTGSRRGRDLLHAWERTAGQFWQVAPKVVPAPKDATGALEVVQVAPDTEELVPAR